MNRKLVYFVDSILFSFPTCISVTYLLCSHRKAPRFRRPTRYRPYYWRKVYNYTILFWGWLISVISFGSWVTGSREGAAEWKKRVIIFHCRTPNSAQSFAPWVPPKCLILMDAFFNRTPIFL